MARFAALAVVLAAVTVAVLAIRIAPDRSPAPGAAPVGVADVSPRASGTAGGASAARATQFGRVLVRAPVYPALEAPGDLTAPASEHADSGVGIYRALAAPESLLLPGEQALARARRFARSRPGVVSFAVADVRGGVHGLAAHRAYPSASLTKAMILVARLRALAAAGEAPSESEAATLGLMIRLSDNASADQVYATVGDAPLLDLARRAGMRDFAISGDWANATLTAADQARFFLALDRLLPRRFRGFARELLRTVSPLQSWGIPRAARPGWRVYFKGGWRPQEDGELVNQAALLERGSRRISIAVLTSASALMADGERTIEGIAARLLAPPGGCVRGARAGQSTC
ncbi:MAG: serine hydrolase [Thermoleophilaceae bacterium]